jgi:hypothetical protein
MFLPRAKCVCVGEPVEEGEGVVMMVVVHHRIRQAGQDGFNPPRLHAKGSDGQGTPAASPKRHLPGRGTGHERGDGIAGPAHWTATRAPRLETWFRPTGEWLQHPVQLVDAAGN